MSRIFFSSSQQKVLKTNCLMMITDSSLKLLEPQKLVFL